ncbi:hypothetical protein CDEST_12582 [Colletotrichum destructivum]|uniref:Uncharacterized protein n=1 Tax=Colletotrichum destructivum TaxID=34406 RepID=A0AAX4IWC2_9PEZI|nr:hypothetical protein CDEST_12582 [Colletotrichum destructivum]
MRDLKPQGRPFAVSALRRRRLRRLRARYTDAPGRANKRLRDASSTLSHFGSPNGGLRVVPKPVATPHQTALNPRRVSNCHQRRTRQSPDDRLSIPTFSLGRKLESRKRRCPSEQGAHTHITVRTHARMPKAFWGDGRKPLIPQSMSDFGRVAKGGLHRHRPIASLPPPA